MVKENFERELKRSIENYPEYHFFDKESVKDLFVNSCINVYDGIKDFDLLLEYNNLKLYLNLYGYPEAGHCAYFNSKDYEFRIEGTDEELYTKTLPYCREYIVKNGVEELGIFAKDIPVLEVFNIANLDTQIRRVWDGLNNFFNQKELENEYKNIIKSKGNLNCQPHQNKIIKTFQSHIFHYQQSVYQNIILRRKLIQNRMKYKFKLEHELSDSELLSGCKIAGLCPTYSYFSPLWLKYFIEKYNVKRVYDPFGGWGHRLLGAHNLELYIYNDISEPTYNGICDIINFLNIKNTELHCENAANFKPKSQYDAVFTCPPYDNTEIYTQKIDNFKDLIKESLDCGDVLYGIVMAEKYENILPIGELIEKSPVNTSKSHFGKSNFEYLYIFRK